MSFHDSKRGPSTWLSELVSWLGKPLDRGFKILAPAFPYGEMEFLPEWSSKEIVSAGLVSWYRTTCMWLSGAGLYSQERTSMYKSGSKGLSCRLVMYCGPIWHDIAHSQVIAKFRHRLDSRRYPTAYFQVHAIWYLYDDRACHELIYP